MHHDAVAAVGSRIFLMPTLMLVRLTMQVSSAKHLERCMVPGEGGQEPRRFRCGWKRRQLLLQQQEPVTRFSWRTALPQTKHAGPKMAGGVRASKGAQRNLGICSRRACCNHLVMVAAAASSQPCSYTAACCLLPSMRSSWPPLNGNRL